MSENLQVIVIGGGASGLTAAVVAAQNGACLLYTSDAADD